MMEEKQTGAPEQSKRWFREAKFGMFVHWGVYSVNALSDWILRIRMPLSEFRKYGNRFKPDRFNPDEWVRTAKETGMKYLVFTTRHHDGFSNFDTRYSDFNSMKSAAKRDLVREVVEACRRGGLKVGLYYSLINWQFPSSILGPEKLPDDWKQMVEIAHGQVRELLTNYGKIDILWYDGTGPSLEWRAEELNGMARTLQPHILINNRSGIKADFLTPEQKVEVPAKGELWETCMTMNSSWFYIKGDHDWKKPEDIIWILATCVHNGGNLLLNVGPRGDGSFPPQAIKRLKKIGEWMRANGEAIYDTVPYPFNYYDQNITAARGKTAYLFLHPRNHQGKTFILGGIANRIVSVRILGTGEKLHFSARGERYFIKLPRLTNNSVHVLALELDSEPEGKPWGLPDSWPFREE